MNPRAGVWMLVLGLILPFAALADEVEPAKDTETKTEKVSQDLSPSKHEVNLLIFLTSLREKSTLQIKIQRVSSRRSFSKNASSNSFDLISSGGYICS